MKFKSPAGTVGAHIEIVELKKRPVEPGDLITTSEVRINGQSLWASAENPVVVERVVAGGPDGPDLVRVTLTLLASRVEFKAEEVAE